MEEKAVVPGCVSIHVRTNAASPVRQRQTLSSTATCRKPHVLPAPIQADDSCTSASGNPLPISLTILRDHLRYWAFHGSGFALIRDTLVFGFDLPTSSAVFLRA